MRRSLTALLAALLLAGCGAGDDDGATVEGYNEAVAVGPFADWDQEALDSLGETACADIRENGMGAYVAVIDALEAEGLDEDQATRAASAFVVRFCPDVADD